MSNMFFIYFCVFKNGAITDATGEIMFTFQFIKQFWAINTNIYTLCTASTHLRMRTTLQKSKNVFVLQQKTAFEGDVIWGILYTFIYTVIHRIYTRNTASIHLREETKSKCKDKCTHSYYLRSNLQLTNLLMTFSVIILAGSSVIQF